MRDRQRISSYFLEEWRVLLAVTVFGLIYNLGLLAGPWFEGKMTGCLLDILDGRAAYQNMLILVGLYVAVIGLVQLSRYLKRFYVRRFANNVNRQMKQILYHSLVNKSRAELEEEGAGNVQRECGNSQRKSLIPGWRWRPMPECCFFMISGWR